MTLSQRDQLLAILLLETILLFAIVQLKYLGLLPISYIHYLLDRPFFYSTTGRLMCWGVPLVLIGFLESSIQKCRGRYGWTSASFWVSIFIVGLYLLVLEPTEWHLFGDSHSYLMHSPHRSPVYPWFLDAVYPIEARPNLLSNPEKLRNFGFIANVIEIVRVQKIIAFFSAVLLFGMLSRLWFFLPVFGIMAIVAGSYFSVLPFALWEMKVYLSSILTEGILYSWFLLILVLQLWQIASKPNVWISCLLGVWASVGFLIAPRMITILPCLFSGCLLLRSHLSVGYSRIRILSMAVLPSILLMVTVFLWCKHIQDRFGVFNPSPSNYLVDLAVALQFAPKEAYQNFEDPKLRELTRRVFNDPSRILTDRSTAVWVRTIAILRKHYPKVYPEYDSDDFARMNLVMKPVAEMLLSQPEIRIRCLGLKMEMLITYVITKPWLLLLNLLTISFGFLIWFLNRDPIAGLCALWALTSWFNVLVILSKMSLESRYLDMYESMTLFVISVLLCRAAPILRRCLINWRSWATYYTLTTRFLLERQPA